MPPRGKVRGAGTHAASRRGENDCRAPNGGDAGEETRLCAITASSTPSSTAEHPRVFDYQSSDKEWTRAIRKAAERGWQFRVIRYALHVFASADETK
jgi:hypothetical protein